MAERVILRAVTGDTVSAMVTGELGYIQGTSNLVLAGFGGVPAAPVDPSVVQEITDREAADAAEQAARIAADNAEAAARAAADATHLTITVAAATYEPLLGFTPYNITNPAGYQDAADVAAAVAVETARATAAEADLAPLSNPVFLAGITIGGAGGPTWTQGTGAPGATEPIGSLYSRAGGALGATLYVSRGGGVWNAIPGV